LGIAAAAGLAYLFLYMFGAPVGPEQRVLAVLVMISAGVLEGVITGYWQWLVLSRRFEGISAGSWLTLTALGAASGWFLGTLPSVYFARGISEALHLSRVLLVFFAALAGMILGGLFGIFQWLELRRHSNQAGLWIPANALGWVLGLALIYFMVSLQNPGMSPAVVIGLGAIAGLSGGLVVGAVTGWFLIRIEPFAF